MVGFLNDGATAVSDGAGGVVADRGGRFHVYYNAAVVRPTEASYAAGDGGGTRRTEEISRRIPQVAPTNSTPLQFFFHD